MSSSNLFHITFRPIIVVAVALVVAASLFIVPASAYSLLPPASGTNKFVAGSYYPYSDELPYGSNTLVIEFQAGSVYYSGYRYLCAPGSVYTLYAKITNYTVKFDLYIASDSPIYEGACDFRVGLEFSGNAHNYGDPIPGYDYYFHESVSLSSSASIAFCASNTSARTVSSVSGASIVNPTILQYPTRGEAQHQEMQSKLNEIQSSVHKDVSQAASDIKEGVSKAAGEVVSGVNNAGSDMPTLNTDDSWMNESVTKMNDWISQVDDFQYQMSRNVVENSSVMAEAHDVIDGFFDKIPTVIIIALSTALIILVVVKVVGR